MKDAPIAHALELGAYRALRGAIMARPHAEVRALGARIGRLGHRVAVGARSTARRNLSLALPTLPRSTRRRIERAAFENFAAQLCESISLDRFGPDELLDLFDLEGWEILDQLARSPRGALLHTGHFGSWEAALHPFGMLLDRFYAVARPADNPSLDAELRHQRERHGARLLGKIGASHRMLALLRRGARIAIIIDQHIRPIAAIRVPFMGRMAWTSPVLAMLALRTRAPIVPFACRPLPGGRYRLTIREPIDPEELRGRGSRDEAEQRLTVRVLEEVERDVRADPELYLWMSRRWRDYLLGS